LKIDCPGLNIDSSDLFPRYYMSLKTAKEEAKKWLFWRLYKYSQDSLELIMHNAKLRLPTNEEFIKEFRDARILDRRRQEHD
jgi:hypothetical protein